MRQVPPADEDAVEDVTRGALAWARAELHATRITNIRRLPGGTATEVYVLHLDGSTRTRAVLKLFTDQVRNAAEPETAGNEARTLACMAHSTIPVPALLAADPAGAVAGFPALLMDWVDGTVELPAAPSFAWLAKLAAPLRRVHAHACEHQAELPEYEPWVDWENLAVPPWTGEPTAWADALARLNEPAPGARRVLLHRDHHPTNVLWQNGELSAVLDWANACVGAPAADYAHCRGNLVHLWGVEAADAFLSAATDLQPEDRDPWWDIASLAEWLPGPTIYEGWTALGVDWLNPDVIVERLDDYVLSLVR